MTRRLDWARARELSPWITRDALWAGQGLVLATVSAYYSTVWALENSFPAALAWSLFVAFEIAVAIGLVVMRHPRDESARAQAISLVVGSALAAALVNALAHGLDRGVIPVSDVSVILTGAAIPLMLAWSSHVARGMAPRPRNTADVPVLTGAALATLIAWSATATTTRSARKPAARKPSPPVRAEAPRETTRDELDAKRAANKTAEIDAEILAAWDAGSRLVAAHLDEKYETNNYARGRVATLRKQHPGREPGATAKEA